MREFPASPITALIDQTPRYNLGESMGADLTVAELLGPDGRPGGPGGGAGLAGVRLGYGTSQAIRSCVPWWLPGTVFRDGQVLITSGATAALFVDRLDVRRRRDPGRGGPATRRCSSALRGIGAQVVTVHSRFDDGYHIDIDVFAGKLSAQTRLVMVASPQNPSGVAITDSEVEQMLAAMSRRCPEALLLIDETFREAAYGGTATRCQLRRGGRRACSPAPRCPRPTVRPACASAG